MGNSLQESASYVEALRAAGKSDTDIVGILRRGGWEDRHLRALEPLLSLPLMCLDDDIEVQLQPVGAAVQEETKVIEPTVTRGTLPLLFPDAPFDPNPDKPMFSPSGEFAVYRTRSVDDGPEEHWIAQAWRGQIQWQVSTGKREPWEGAISNCGHAVATLWSPTKTPNDDLVVFSPAGELLLRKHFRSALNSCGLSDDCRLVWCITGEFSLVIMSLLNTDHTVRRDAPNKGIVRMALSGDEIIYITEDDAVTRLKWKHGQP